MGRIEKFAKNENEFNLMQQNLKKANFKRVNSNFWTEQWVNEDRQLVIVNRDYPVSK